MLNKTFLLEVFCVKSSFIADWMRILLVFNFRLVRCSLGGKLKEVYIIKRLRLRSNVFRITKLVLNTVKNVIKDVMLV